MLILILSLSHAHLALVIKILPTTVVPANAGRLSGLMLLLS